MSIESTLKVLQKLHESDSYAEFLVHQHNRDLRLIRMSAELSSSAFFRAGFRKDQPNLATLDHRGILRFVGWGEENGQLYYLTEVPEGVSLADRIDEGQRFSLDEITDISWQLASALQHAHNQGIAHGHLTLESITTSQSLRVQISGFGLYRWIAETRHRQVTRWTDLVRRDVRELGRIIEFLVDSAEESSPDHAPFHKATLCEIVEWIDQNSNETTARDVQRKLGNLLLNVAGDSISLVDNRKGQGLSRRSIVDELFDDVSDAKNLKRKTKAKSGCLGVLLLVIATCLIKIILD